MLSVTIITLNEEKNLRRCLESVAFADEIIVLDSGSEDHTLPIAREFTNKVFQEPWQGFARQKNLAQDKAQGPWILNIDADERVTPALREEILSVFKKSLPMQDLRSPGKIFFVVNGSAMAGGTRIINYGFIRRMRDPLPNGKSTNRWWSRERSEP